MYRDSWNTPNTGAMSNANQALSYIIFVRDKKLFEEKFPNLEIVCQKPSSILFRYLFSGGLNFKQIFPNSFYLIIKMIDYISAPLDRWTAIFHYIVIKRK